MSTIIMSACWPLQGMNASQKAVLISLADNANDDGVCWPSVDYISKRTCLSPRAVQNAIRWLVDAGALEANERQGRSTVYTVTPAAFAPLQNMRPAKTVDTPAKKVATPADAAPTPADAAPRTINNRKGTVKEPSLDFSSWPEMPNEQVWKDYKRLRAGKKAAITQTFVNRLGDELKKASAMGYSVNDFLSECILRGWQGGKAEWLENKQQKSRPPRNNSERNADWNARLAQTISDTLDTPKHKEIDMGVIHATH